MDGGIAVWLCWSLRAGGYASARGRHGRHREARSFDGTGLILKTDAGKFERIPWGKVSQTSLKELIKNPSAKRFAQPFIRGNRRTRREAEAQGTGNRFETCAAVRKTARQTEPAGGVFLALGLTLMGVFYLANLFAAYQVAIFRHQPFSLVCGVAAAVPWVSPAVFLCFAARSPPSEEAALDATAEDGAPGQHADSSAPGQPRRGTEPAPACGCRHAHWADEGAIAETKVFTRGEYTFNRRFFETKAAGFFRVVPVKLKGGCAGNQGGRRRVRGAGISRNHPNECTFNFRKEMRRRKYDSLRGKQRSPDQDKDAK